MKLMEFYSAPPYGYGGSISESKIEEYLVMLARINGGLAIKNDAKLRRGIPDRTLIMPEGIVVFVEVKREGKRPTKVQERRIKELLDMDQYVDVVDYKKGCLDLIKWCKEVNEWTT